MEKIVIIGAGAIGRGFLPWVFAPNDYAFVFVDSNPKIIDGIKKAGSFHTHRVNGDVLETRVVRAEGAFLPQEFSVRDHSDVAATFVSVGPRNAVAAAKLVEGVEGPVILCENDPATVEHVKGATSLRRVFFGVPDVITSNTAPAHLLAEDALAIVTEAGTLFVDENIGPLRGEFQKLSTHELLHKQWTAKLYLHNTPHCIAAYLGRLVGVEYIHEAMAVPEVGEIVEGAMKEMLQALKLQWDLPHAFLDGYAQKELSRFRCKLLFDPIARVAREPLRKLRPDERLIGATEICLSHGFVPHNVLLGIASAVLFNDPHDPDRHIGFMREALGPKAFVTHVLNLRHGEALSLILQERLDVIIRKLETIVRRVKDTRA